MKTKNLSRKQVRETVYGKGISAWIILKNGNHIATVQAAFLDSGNVLVDVWDKHSLVYQGKAGGYGYDKLNAALSGAVIDGVKIYDHCGTDEITEGFLTEYLSNPKKYGDWAKERAASIGAHFANWNTEKQCYTSLYYEGGLSRLQNMIGSGYQVIQAI